MQPPLRRNTPFQSMIIYGVIDRMPISTPERKKLKCLGQRIREQRLAAKLTQEKLSEKAELNLRNLQKIEAGELNILVTTLMRIQKALSCPWNDLMKED